MGILKKQQEETKASWDRKNERCDTCGGNIPYSERHEYFETGKCSACDNHYQRMMSE